MFAPLGDGARQWAQPQIRSMTEPAVRVVQPEDWPTAREIRLRALADAPSAFGSTLARESAFDDAEWQRRIAPGNWLIALVDGQAVGIVATVPEEGRPEEGQLVGMWVEPAHRGTTVATLLVQEVIDAARQGGFTSLSLWVVDGNLAARRLYERMGFTGTGRRQQLPSNPLIGEERMRREL